LWRRRRCNSYSLTDRHAYCAPDPARGRPIFLPEYQAQLRRVLLNVAHIVEQELAEAHHPLSKYALVLSALICQRVNRFLALRAAMQEIRVKFIFGIDPIGKQAGRIKLIERKRSRGDESFDGASEVEGKPEECVVGDVPILLILRTVA